MSKRFTSPLAAASTLAIAGALALAGGASGAASLPTMTIALNGSSSISVGGTPVSGAINVVSTFTGNGQGQAGLVRLNPAVSPAVAFAQASQAVQSHHGDLNALTPLGDAVVFDAGAPSSAQTVLTPGTYVALNLTGHGQPPNKMFTVTQSASPAALPAPGGTVGSIEFGFRGPRTLHRGELVRFENDGFLVHMIVGIRVKNLALAAAETKALQAGKTRLARHLSIGGANFAGPLSPSGLQQLVVNEKPGIYVLACFMNTQDGREHTQLGMERTIRVVK
jgi:hypothetical protein